MTEFTHFNPVIRLSKVKQSALFQVSPAVSLLVELLAAVPGFNFFPRSLQLQAVKPPFPIMLERQTAVTSLHVQAQGHALGMVSLSFGTFGEVNKLCT